MASLIAGGVDCDVHPAVPHLTSLLPYLNDYCCLLYTSPSPRDS